MSSDRIENMDMIKAAQFVVKTLIDAGYEAYEVGGCVRDVILNRPCKDRDVATNARPDKVMELFSRTIPVGVAFGVVVVVVDGIQIEVATFRTDAAVYADGRHPEAVFYSDSAREDVIRRDFTMNGLLFGQDIKGIDLAGATLEQSATGTIIDFVGGLADIDAKVIRCIGDPVTRFTEDALRMMRAVRFAAQLGFDIEENTKKAIIHMGKSITKISNERIRMELEKLLTGDFAARGLALLFGTGLAKHIFQRVDCFRLREILERFERFHVLTPLTGLAMLLTSFFGDGDEEYHPDSLNDIYLEGIIDSLMLSNNDRKELEGALYNQGALRSAHLVGIANLKRLARKPGIYTAALLLEQDMCLTDTQNSAVQATIAKVRGFIHNDLYPRPLVTGDDLIALGMKPSSVFSTILGEVETKQLNGELVDRDAALSLVKSLLHD